MRHWICRAWKENKSFLIFIALMLIFRSAVADWNEVPTGSMKPTLFASVNKALLCRVSGLVLFLPGIILPSATIEIIVQTPES